MPPTIGVFWAFAMHMVGSTLGLAALPLALGLCLLCDSRHGASVTGMERGNPSPPDYAKSRGNPYSSGVKDGEW